MPLGKNTVDPIDTHKGPPKFSVSARFGKLTKRTKIWFTINNKGDLMRFFTEQYQYYCGIDLHSKEMYVCIIDKEGEVQVHRNIRANPEEFLNIIKPYRGEIVVAVECIFTWYWIADLCRSESIRFVLGHALYMKAIHGGKTKNDRIDSEKIARLLKGGMLPEAYVYPPEMRGVRDLMRRRLHFVRKRADLMAHVQMTHQQYNLTPPGRRISSHVHREGMEDVFNDPAVKLSVAADSELIGNLTILIRGLESKLEKLAGKSFENKLALTLLQTIPGIGPVLSRTILFEMQDISRFPTVQKFCSYARLVKPTHTSSGKKVGTGGRKIGNPHLRWAFAEAVMVFLRDEEFGKKIMETLLRKYSKSKAISVLSHKLARAAYYMLLRGVPFDRDKFFREASA